MRHAATSAVAALLLTVALGVHSAAAAPGTPATVVAPSASAAIVVRDDRGADVAFAATPQRVVSLLPSLTESVCAIGACARLVGTDRYSNWPARVTSLPKLGGLDDVQVERLVMLKPELVLISASERVVDRLESLGLKVVVLESRNGDDVRRSLALLGRLFDRAAEADAVWARIGDERRAAAARVPPSLRGQRVYFEVDSTPYAAGPGSFIGESLMHLGMANAVAAELGAFPKLNPEYVVRAQPDVIMAAARDLEDMPRRPGWSALHALQRRKTCGFRSDRYDLLVRPGPRMGEAAGLLADCLAGIATR